MDYLNTDTLGIWFLYKGNSVCFRWPWNRLIARFKYSDKSGRKRWLVRMGGWAEFNTLKELDDFWQSYFEELEKRR